MLIIVVFALNIPNEKTIGSCYDKLGNEIIGQHCIVEVPSSLKINLYGISGLMFAMGFLLFLWGLDPIMELGDYY